MLFLLESHLILNFISIATCDCQRVTIWPGVQNFEGYPFVFRPPSHDNLLSTMSFIVDQPICAVEFGLYSKYSNQRLWLQMLVICNQARMHNDNIIPNLCFMKLAIPLPPMSPLMALGRCPGCISARGPQRVDISGQCELDAAVQQQLYIA